MRNDRTVLTEKRHIIYAVAYLTALKKYREVACSVVCEDEMYVRSCLTGHKNWSDHCA
jgi:hypothetical protein